MIRGSSSATSTRQSQAPLRVVQENAGMGRRPSTGDRASFSTTSIPTHGSNRTSSEHKRPYSARTSSGSRLSMGKAFGISTGTKTARRSSSIYGQNYGRSEAIKDTRPLQDKGYQRQCIKILLDFLMEHNYPSSISPKLLHNPLSKDVMKIFEFLIGFLIPGYQLPKKIEEEIPRLFKQLQFPFMISKSSLFAIGSPHTWPALLSAIVWLVENIQFCEQLNNNSLEELVFDDFDAASDDMVKFQHTFMTYKAFLGGAENYEKEDADLERCLNEKTFGVAGDIDTLTDENNRLEQELDLLNQDPDQIKNLHEQKQVLLVDSERFINYAADMDSHIDKVLQNIDELTEEQKTLIADRHSTIDNNKRMQVIFEQQEFSCADVDRFRYCTQELQRQLETMQKELDKLNSSYWADEMALAKIQENVHTICSDYNESAQRAKLIPSTAENANGKNYEMRANYSGKNEDFMSSIKPALYNLMSLQSDRKQDLTQKQFMLSEQNDQLQDIITQCQTSIANYMLKQKRVEDDYENTKERFQDELRNHNAEIERLQTEIMALRRAPTDVPSYKKDLIETKKWIEQKEANWRKEVGIYDQFLQDAMLMIVDHKSDIQEHIKKMVEDAKKKKVPTATLR